MNNLWHFENHAASEGRRSVAGIDEAGRGPVLGPLVVAGVVLRPQRASALTRRGVSVSKEFGAGEDARLKRAELAGHIRQLNQALYSPEKTAWNGSELHNVFKREQGSAGKPDTQNSSTLKPLYNS